MTILSFVCIILNNSTPNKRHDGLNIARGAHAVDEAVVKTEINEKGK